MSYTIMQYVVSKYLDYSQTDVTTQKQGNSVARDLPPKGSEANTTIFSLHHPKCWKYCITAGIFYEY